MDFPQVCFRIVWEPHSENRLDLIFVAPPCKKVIFVSDKNYITPAIRNFMLDMLSSGSFQKIGFKSESNRTQTIHVKPCGSS